MTHFQDGKERITCTGGSLDGRELWIAKGLQRFEVLGHGGTKESYVRDGVTFVMAGGIAHHAANKNSENSNHHY